MKLLLVDDESEALEGMEYYFTGRGHEVLIAHGGYEALALIKACKPQLMLLDLKMKGLSGFEIMREVRKIRLQPLGVQSRSLSRLLDLEKGVQPLLSAGLGLQLIQGIEGPLIVGQP